MLSPAEFYKDREQRVVLVWVATAVAGWTVVDKESGG